MSIKRKYWIGLLLLMIIYAIYFLTAEDQFAKDAHLDRKIRHIIQWVAILLVYGTGSLSLNLLKPRWIIYLWHLAHWVLIPLLILLGLSDWWMGGLPRGLRLFAQSIGETLVSPTIYVLAGLLYVALKKWGIVLEQKDL